MKIKSLNFKGIPAYTYPLDKPATLKRFQLLFIWVILDSKGHCLRFAAPNSLGHD